MENNLSNFEYKDNYDIETRKKKSEELLKKYPNRVPVVLETSPNSHLKKLQKKHYLLPKNRKFFDFHIGVRKLFELSNEQSLFLISNHHILNTDRTIGEIYNLFKDKEDNILYIHIYDEIIYG